MTSRVRSFPLASLIVLLSACGGDGGDPEEPCDSPGTTETVSCGSCGTLERFCSAGGVWVPGICNEPIDACEPGTTEDRACGNCGTQTARCNATCEWEAIGECEGGGICAPGARSQSGEGCGSGETREVLCSDRCEFEPAGECESNECDMPGATETVDCGSCGTTTRFCTAAGVWEFGICNEPSDACEPGTTQMVACGNCGMRESRCLASCQLEAGECLGEGVCAPGALMTTSDGCPAGQERTLRCTDGCAFEEFEGCVGPSTCSPACDPGERCMAGTCQCGSGPACSGSEICSGGRCEEPTGCGMVDVLFVLMDDGGGESELFELQSIAGGIATSLRDVGASVRVGVTTTGLTFTGTVESDLPIPLPFPFPPEVRDGPDGALVRGEACGLRNPWTDGPDPLSLGCL
ncbi:MAG: hypothetical protein AAF411_27150, partial [Myxococcota bacterium]